MPQKCCSYKNFNQAFNTKRATSRRRQKTKATVAAAQTHKQFSNCCSAAFVVVVVSALWQPFIGIVLLPCRRVLLLLCIN